MRPATLIFSLVVLMSLLLNVAFAKSIRQSEDYDYKNYELVQETTADPGLVVDTVPVRSKHHHGHHHHLKTNRLGRLRKYFDEHQYRY